MANHEYKTFRNLIVQRLDNELHYSLCFHPISQKSSVLDIESGFTLYKSVKIKEILNSDHI